MDIQTLKRDFDLISLVQGQVALKKVGAYHVGPCPFCGGVDRFTIKHTPEGDRWHCRGCGGGKYHSVIDFVMRREGLTFREAIQLLGGEGISSPRMGAPSDQGPPRTTARGPIPRSAGLPSESWQGKGREFVLSASDGLLDDQEAGIARDYLRKRELVEGTWLRGLLGYAQVYDPVLKVKRPVVCIPHLDGSLNLSAIKYRFCDPNIVERNPKGLRYSAHKGSRPLLYGLEWLLPKTHPSLLIVEGELNQLSILQVLSVHAGAQPGVSVVSPGSEDLNPVQVALLRRVARAYARRIIWMDKPAVTRQIAQRIQLPCKLLCSPNGLDANDPLQAGLLWRYLEGAVLS
jgi:hypothetical protein